MMRSRRRITEYRRTFMSSSCNLGSRTEFCRKVTMSRLSSKFSAHRNGGILSPSSYLLSAAAGMPPGSQEPFSPSWIVAEIQQTSFPFQNTGIIID